MRKFNTYFALLFLPAMISCNQQPKKPVVKTLATDSLVSSTCYTAVYEQDTANLHLEFLQSGKVTGDLVFRFPIFPKNVGTVEGKFSGDTLFVDYSFAVGKAKEKNYKNPLAFLKKGDQLIMGVGVIETSYGRSHFAKDRPINFERGKFQFNPINCDK